MTSLAHPIPQPSSSPPSVENAVAAGGRLEEVWVSSREAARVLSKTTDYIARLCREGALECRQEGRAWRVQAASMVRFSQRAREAKESIRQAKSERLKHWWETQQWWKFSTKLLLTARIARMTGILLLIGGIGLMGAAFFGYEWGGRMLGVGEHTTPGVFGEKKGRLEASAGWLWSVFQKSALFSVGRQNTPSPSPSPSPSPASGIVVVPFEAGREDTSRRITELFSEPVGVEPKDDRSGIVRSRLAPEEPFLYLMVPVRDNPQTGMPEGSSP